MQSNCVYRKLLREKKILSDKPRTRKNFAYKKVIQNGINNIKILMALRDIKV